MLALAGNAATATSRWPWVLDELRQHPWWTVGLFGVLAVVAGGMTAWLQLRPPAVLNDPPPPPSVIVPDWFVDRVQTRTAAAAVCGKRRSVGITTSLSGAGGFGKTTLATAVCARQRVRWRFRSRMFPPLRPRIYFVTIGRDVRGGAAVAAKVVEVTRFITGDTTEFDDPALAGAHLGRLLDQRPRTLLVLDDVWEAEQLDPFLTGGRRCVRLVTTRNPTLLPSMQRIRVDEMSRSQAKMVLTWNLPPLPELVVDALLKATGHWVLLLRLTNRLIAEQCAAGADPTATVERILHRLRENGPAAVDGPAIRWNLDDPRLRNQAVKASIEAATTLLPLDGADRFTELGIFAAGESIPIPVVAQLWQASGQLTDDHSRSLCLSLERLSLLALNPRRGGTLSLHDVIRDYLRSDLGATGLARLNGLLIDAIVTTLPRAQPLTPSTGDLEHAWWQVPDGYLLDHLIDHMLTAGRTAAAEAVAGDVRWVETRLAQRGPTAPWRDLARIDTPHTRPLARSLAQAAHLLSPTDPPHALTGVLHTRLGAHPYWHPQVAARQHEPAQRPCITHQWPFPDAPSPALHRTLTGHTKEVHSVMIAPDGTWLTSIDRDGAVRFWDRATGTCTGTLTGHTATGSVAIAPDGTWFVTSGLHGIVEIWDRATETCITSLPALEPYPGLIDRANPVAITPGSNYLGTADKFGNLRIWERATRTWTDTLTGHAGSVQSVAIAPDGTWLATIDTFRRGEIIQVWERATRIWTTISTGRTGSVESVAIAPDGTWLAAARRDATVRIWDRVTGIWTDVFPGYTSSRYSASYSVVIAPDSTWLALHRSEIVQIWDRATETWTSTLTGHTGPVHSVAIAPDGTWLATASSDETVRIWDRATGTCIATLTDRAQRPVHSVAIAPDGTWLASADYDGVVRIWDRATGTCTTTLTGHTGSVHSVAIAPDGTWL
ncbi:NB-ARC domain-containing protein, partial [Streptomyces sp. NPDC057621]|uniref:WD40 domain-containing protein n=1 Tax=Streptomyces sp. NPDC057621 TaxID=3346186 RepID=UPI0036818C4B